MKSTQLLATACLMAIGTLSVFAQERPSVQLNPSEGTFKVLSVQPASGKVVTNQPYSAIAVTETIQTLSDGNQITRTNQAKLFRDSLGRTRTEQTLGTIGKWSAGAEPPQLITVNDPVAGLSFSLDPQARTVLKSSASINDTDSANAADKVHLRQDAMEKAMAQKKEMLAAQGKTLPGFSEDVKQMKLAGAAASEYAKGAGIPQKEPLGRQIIEGVEAEGVRVAYTIPAGEAGNRLPIEITMETWYSPDLQMVVLSKQHDPRYGDTTYRLTNISRSEPDGALFQVPAGYKLGEHLIMKKSKPTNDQ